MSKFSILEGKVEAVLRGVWPNSSMSMEVSSIQCFIGHGIKGDKHAEHRASDAREDVIKAFGLPKDIEVANVRQFSAISVEELAKIGKYMGLKEKIPYGCLGENLVVSGISNFSQLPPNTKLLFEAPTGEKKACVLSVYDQNGPCLDPGKNIAEKFGNEKLASMFVRAAMGRRGVVGIVYVSGKIKTGDKIFAYIPKKELEA